MRTSVTKHLLSFIVKIILLSFFFLILIHPGLSIHFAADGLILWYQTVIPTLLPCMILSSLLVQTNAAKGLISFLHPIIGRLLGTSPNGTYCFLIGLLCGYPMGAKTCADMLRSKKISLKEGTYLMAFIHFPSPMFVIGYIASSHLVLFSPLPILSAVYLPLIPMVFLAKRTFRPQTSCFSPNAQEPAPINLTPALMDEIIASCSSIMIKIGIFIMLFTMLAKFILNAPIPSGDTPFSILFTGIFCGLLEMTTGIGLAAQTELPILIKGCLICFFAAFGGLSVAMQTQSVLSGSGLSIKPYFLWQFLHGLFSIPFFLLFYTVIPH